MSVPRSVTIEPHAPSYTASTAAMPRRVASTRSYADRRAAALDVAEHGVARLDAGALLDDRGEPLGDAAEARAVERVEALVRVRLLHVVEVEALGDDDERRATAVAHGLHPLADLVDRLRLLGDEDRVRAAGHARVQRDPADVAAHDLDARCSGRATRRWCAAGRSPRSRSRPRCRSRTSSRWPRGRCRWSSARRRSSGRRR